MALRNASDTPAKSQDRLRYLASLSQDDVLSELDSSMQGLTPEQVETSREEKLFLRLSIHG